MQRGGQQRLGGCADNFHLEGRSAAEDIAGCRQNRKGIHHIENATQGRYHRLGNGHEADMKRPGNDLIGAGLHLIPRKKQVRYSFLLPTPA